MAFTQQGRYGRSRIGRITFATRGCAILQGSQSVKIVRGTWSVLKVRHYYFGLPLSFLEGNIHEVVVSFFNFFAGFPFLHVSCV